MMPLEFYPSDFKYKFENKPVKVANDENQEFTL